MKSGSEKRAIEPTRLLRWVILIALAIWVPSVRAGCGPAEGGEPPEAEADRSLRARLMTPSASEMPPAFAPPGAALDARGTTAFDPQTRESQDVELTQRELNALQTVFPETPYQHITGVPAHGAASVRRVSEQTPVPDQAFIVDEQPLDRINAANGSGNNREDQAFADSTLNNSTIEAPTALDASVPPQFSSPVVDHGGGIPNLATPPGEASQLPVNQFGHPGIEFGAAAPQQDPPLALPPGATPWWQNQIGTPLRHTSLPRPVSINGLIAAALEHSAQVQVISDTPLIRDTAIIEADSAFDWRTFMETAWNNRNEPVGSVLTTGGPSRFRDQRIDYDLGLRRKLGTGGQFEVGQRYGYEESNSVFFVPNNQGTSRLTLNYTQPLLRGAGRGYSTSLIVLAQIDSAIARDDFSRQLQEHLLEVARAYWSLYLERANLLQRQRLYERGQEVLEELSERESIDAVSNQIVRARAAVAARRSALIRSAAAVKNSEGRIRALVNAPELGVLDEFELMPTDMPSTDLIPVDLRQSLEVAVRKRPELNVALKQIKGSAVRLDMSKNELLPVLDVVLETYFAGLSGNSSIGSAWSNQYSVGGPSYTAGLQFEVPLRNRESRSRFQRRALELRQFQNQFRNTIHALQLEVEIAVREVETSYRELAAKYDAMMAADAELEFIKNRWELLPGEDRTASLVLEDMLAAQERLAIVEFDFATSAVTYNLSMTNLKRAMGTLLEFEQISVEKTDDCGIPAISLHKMDGAATLEPTLAPQFGPE